MFKKLIPLTLILLLKAALSLAQLIEGPINHLLDFKPEARSLPSASDTLNLPFWDDFSNSKYSVDTALWQYGQHIFVNNSRAYLPPSYNVATFDGFDGSGNAYSNDTQLRAIADSLVSRPIDLSSYTVSSNIFLSFFWQEAFGEQSPDSQDSLRLSFKNGDNQWEQVFSTGGSGLSEPDLFRQVFRAINQQRFLHAGFQFKFELLGNLAGDFDVFHIDYIYLNEGNTPVNTTGHAYDSYEDRTFSKAPKSIFGEYYAIPLLHLEQDWLESNLQETSFVYNNLWAGNANNPLFGTEIFGLLKDTLKPASIIDSLQINGNFLTQNQDTALFTAQSRQPQSLINHLLQEQKEEDSVYLQLQLNLGTNDSLFFETINGVTVYYPELSFRRNDTVSTIYPLHDFYATDDGTAESSIRLNSKNYQLAQEFNVIGEHYMTGIDIYIPNLGQNSGTQNITLLVWDELTTDPFNIKLAQNVLVNPAPGINDFHRYEFENPLFIGGRIFVGYREENDEVVSIGFDKESNSATGLYYNQSGSWEQDSLLVGSVMIRPVFAKNTVTVSNKPKKIKEKEFSVYPNPNKGLLKYDGAFELIQIFNANGQLVLSVKADGSSSKPIDITHLKDGLYFVNISVEGGISAHKIILKK